MSNDAEGEAIAFDASDRRGEMSRRKSHDPTWLEARGYDGLYANFNAPLGGDGCGCGLNDFAPCMEGPFPECVPARIGDESRGESPALFYPAKLRKSAVSPTAPPEDREP
jgi:hypothetical protein